VTDRVKDALEELVAVCAVFGAEPRLVQANDGYDESLAGALAAGAIPPPKYSGFGMYLALANKASPSGTRMQALVPRRSGAGLDHYAMFPNGMFHRPPKPDASLAPDQFEGFVAELAKATTAALLGGVSLKASKRRGRRIVLPPAGSAEELRLKMEVAGLAAR